MTEEETLPISKPFNHNLQQAQTQLNSGSKIWASQYPRIGVGVFILSSPPHSKAHRTFILGHRLSSHGHDTYGLPGGHLELGESFADCAEREVLEETGLHITTPRFLTATNDIWYDEKRGWCHYVTIFMVCERASEHEGKEAEVREKEKCGGWKEVKWSDVKRWAALQEPEMKQIVNGEEKDEGTVSSGERLTLFSPMVALVKQRPEVDEILM